MKDFFSKQLMDTEVNKLYNNLYITVIEINKLYFKFTSLIIICVNLLIKK